MEVDPGPGNQGWSFQGTMGRSVQERLRRQPMGSEGVDHGGRPWMGSLGLEHRRRPWD